MRRLGALLGRSPVWLVVAREARTLVRSKAFLIGNIAILLAVVLGGVAGSLQARESVFRLGVADDEAATVAERAVAPAGQTVLGAELVIADAPADRAEAEAAVADGRLDGVLLGGSELIVDERPPALVLHALNTARHIGAVDTALADAGLGPVERETVLATGPLEVTSLAEAPPLQPRRMIVATAATGLLYVMLIAYGNRVAQSIVEEKASRVIEVVLAAIRPAQLLGGKVLGIGGLSLLQALVFGALIGGTVLLVTDVTPTGGDLVTLGWVVLWYLPGYALYAMLFAVVGALMPREQDLQSAAVPVLVLIVGGLVSLQLTITNPQSTAATISGLVPLSAPMVQPLRLATGVAPVWEPVVAAVLTLATVVVLVPIAARLYAGGVLHTRTRVSLRRAWRSAESRRPATS